MCVIIYTYYKKELLTRFILISSIANIYINKITFCKNGPYIINTCHYFQTWLIKDLLIASFFIIVFLIYLSYLTRDGSFSSISIRFCCLLLLRRYRIVGQRCRFLGNHFIGMRIPVYLIGVKYIGAPECREKTMTKAFCIALWSYRTSTLNDFPRQECM